MSEQFSTCCGLNLLSSHLLHTLYTSHLGHHLLDDVQVQAVLGLQLVGHVPEVASQLYGGFLVYSSTEGGEGSQPRHSLQALDLSRIRWEGGVSLPLVIQPVPLLVGEVSEH